MQKHTRTGVRAALCTLAVAAGTALSASAAMAQDEFSLLDWTYDEAYQGWSAEELLDFTEADVYGPNGDEIGSVENLLINDQGQIVAIIAQVGGFWDISDTHVAVPWEETTWDGMEVTIPITEDNVGDYSVFKDEYFSQVDVGSLGTVDDDLETGPGIWKATDLIDDYAVLETGMGYGYVNDLIFDHGGQLQAVVVNTNSGFMDNDYYAYPWYGYGYDGYAWNPGLDRYVLPYDENEVSDLVAPFEYDRISGR